MNDPTDPRLPSSIRALELAFLIVVLAVVLAAFVTALGYKLVSSRTPLVIMAPLIGLLIFHGARLLRQGAARDLAEQVRRLGDGSLPGFAKLWKLSLALVGMLCVIEVFGLVAGTAAFMLVLLRGLARESWKTTLALTVAVVGAIWAVFTLGFGIELWPGLIWRWYLGYRDF